MEAYPPSKPLLGRAPSQLAFAIPSDRRSINSHLHGVLGFIRVQPHVAQHKLALWLQRKEFLECGHLEIFLMLQSWSYLISLREYDRIPSSHFSRTQTFGSTSSMLDHRLQQLLNALTHDTVSCDSSSVKATSAEYHCTFWYFTTSFFQDVSAFSSNRSSTSFFNPDQSPCQPRSRSPLEAPHYECR